MTILATDRATEEVALAAGRKPIEFGDHSTGERNSEGQIVRFGSKAAVDAKWDRRPVCPDSRHDTRLIDLRLRAIPEVRRRTPQEHDGLAIRAAARATGRANVCGSARSRDEPKRHRVPVQRGNVCGPGRSPPTTTRL